MLGPLLRSLHFLTIPIPPRLLRHRQRLQYLQLLLSVLILFPLLSYLLLSSLPIHYTTSIPLLQSTGFILVVTAHPDDEALFFAPTITALSRLGAPTKVGLLVLSSGGHYGMGEVRAGEQTAACGVEGIWGGGRQGEGRGLGGGNAEGMGEEEYCVVLGVNGSGGKGVGEVKGFEDDPKADWDEERVRQVVGVFVKRWGVDVIITFDSSGVSGHRNHKSVSRAIVNWAKSDPQAPTTYTLTTTNVLRKYSFLLDLPLTAFKYGWNAFRSLSSGYEREPALFVSSFSRWLQGVRAFQQHRSQNTWDRHLYVVVSRYMWFNDLKLVDRA